MSRVGLKQLLARSAEARALVDAVTASLGGPLAVEDGEGRHLHGTPVNGEVTRFPVRLEQTTLGAVAGPAHGAALATHARPPGGARGRTQGARHRGSQPLPRDQPDLQLLREARRAARCGARRPAHAAGGTPAHRRHRRRHHAARRRDRRLDHGCRLRRRDAGAGRISQGPGDRRGHRRHRRSRDRQRRGHRSPAGHPAHDDQGPHRRGDARRRAHHRRHRARQHGADGLYRRRAQAAEHPGAAGGHGDGKRAALRAHGAGGGGAGAAAQAEQGDGSRARQAGERAHLRRPHPGGRSSRPSFRRCPVSTWQRATGRPASAAATTTTRSWCPPPAATGCCSAWRMSRARACRPRW